MARSVYIIEIREQWYPLVAPEIESGKRCFYVGETGKDPLVRLREHLTGESSTGNRKNPSAAVFKKMRRSQGDKSLVRGTDVWMRTGLAWSFNGSEMLTTAESEAAEARAIAHLRGLGHVVYPRREV